MGFLVGEMAWLATDFFNGFNGWVFWWVNQDLLATDFFSGFNGWVFWWVKRIGWQRIFLTDLTDGFFGG